MFPFYFIYSEEIFKALFFSHGVYLPMYISTALH